MADLLLDVLVDAHAALLTLGPPVRMDGDPDPGGDEVIVLAPVSDTALPAYGITPTTKRIQVTCYAATLERALTLTTAAAAALRPAGLRFIQSRPAPDPDHTGQVSEYRR